MSKIKRRENPKGAWLRTEWYRGEAISSFG